MSRIYRSKYEAYPFLCDKSEDLRCDFEILTDETASLTGLLRAMINHKDIQEDLLFICELVYHMNPSLRTHTSITPEELARLEKMTKELEKEVSKKHFVLPAGSQSAAMSHVLRVKSKALVRLLYRHIHQGHEVNDILVDTANLLSGYFFMLALKLNMLDKVEEIEYVSRNYLSGKRS